MGLGLYFAEGEGPQFERPLREEWEIRNLAEPDPYEHLSYVLDAVSSIHKALDGSVPLLGFSGSPFTLACYMIEGRGGTDFAIIKRMLYQRPDLLHHVLRINARSVAAYLNAQIEHGANAVMIFDTWGGVLSHAAYQAFSLAYLAEVVSRLHKNFNGEAAPVIVFTKGGGLWLERIAAIGCDAIGCDWTIDIGEARARVGDRVALQGNLDPAILMSAPAVIRREVKCTLDAYGSYPGHVFNLGHGVSQFTPPEHVKALVEAVHELSPPYHV